MSLVLALGFPPPLSVTLYNREALGFWVFLSLVTLKP
jgi:hypothetical protein